ncbi:MAG: retropepsin-like aspartic protease [Verrucomicrobiae bacterium]|nr:retropepsin-like aspartic protease [Verrucomicrobiae bacterium]
MLGRVISFGAIAILCGCAVDPISQLETATPSFTAAQIKDLEQRAQPPSAFGLEMQTLPGGVGFRGPLQQHHGATAATVPLVRIPTAQPTVPGGTYRVPVVTGTVNGRRGVHILLDSGANRHLVGYTLSRLLEVPPLAGVPMMRGLGIGGAVENRLGIIRTMQLGDFELRNQLVLIAPDSQVLELTRSFWGNRQVMIAGVSVWRHLSYLQIDSLRGAATIQATEAYRPGESRQVIAGLNLRWINDLPCVELRIDGQEVGWCALDTGGDYGLLLPRALAAELGYWRRGQEQLATSHGVAGAALDAAYVVREARVGPVVLQNVPGRTNVIGPEPAKALPLLGNVVLRQYCITFDFRTGMLWLER